MSLPGTSVAAIVSPTKDDAAVTRVVTPSSSSTKDDSQQVIDLNVGGRRFTTTKATLCRVPGSTLEAMFSGRHERFTLKDENGAHFIDRDGTHFHHILNFLRVGSVVSLPDNDTCKQELAMEADYFCLDELAKAATQPQMDVLEFLSNKDRAQREHENKLRASQWNGNAQGGPYGGLVPLFCPETGESTLSLVYEPPTEPKFLLMKNLHETSNAGTPVAVASRQDFERSFNLCYPNVLQRLQEILVEEPVVLAGGSVLRALTAGGGIRTCAWWGSTGDIDVFLHTSNREEATRIARRIFYAMAVDHERWVVVRSRGVINIHRCEQWERKIGLKVQIVLRLYDSLSEILLGFDCDCICCAYDGRQVWASPRCISALRTGTNILNSLHAWPNKPSYELRLGKYAFRGFAVAVPGLDKSRVDYESIASKNIANLKGLARLLKVSLEMESAKASDGLVVPINIKALKRVVINGLRADEMVTAGLVDYDDEPEGIIISNAYSEDGETIVGIQWFDYVTDFPHSRVSRDEGWTAVEHARVGTSTVPEGLPARLVDAWDCDKVSREYLNANSMNAIDLDYLYYSQAYDV